MGKPSEWCVMCQNWYGDEVLKMYAVYRLKDVDKPNHSGNQEIYGDGFCGNRQKMKDLAKKLNEHNGCA